MDKIISKLSIRNTDLKYNYLINNVSVGLDLALSNKNVVVNKEAFKQLKTLNEQLKSIPIPTWDGIDMDDQLKAYYIGLEALEIIEKIKK